MAILSCGVSVVIPTYNAKHLLKKTLDSLCNQSLDKNYYEVIVVDDGSADGTSELVQQYINVLNMKYHFQDDLGFRVAKARNEGVRLARFETILLFDSGMIASNNLLSMHMQRHETYHDLVVLGLSYGVSEFTTENSEKLIESVNAEQMDTVFANLVLHPELYDCRFEYLSSINFNLDLMNTPWVIFWTGHVSFKKISFDFVEGFDEWFQSWGGEDVELGIRLHQKGCKFALLHSMESIHYPHHKDPNEKKLNAQNNIRYICDKHKSADVQLLKHHDWEIIAKQSMQFISNEEFSAN